MNDRMHFDTHGAMWRPGALRTRLHLCSALPASGITNVYGTKPGAEAAIATSAATRRGAPPH